ncbi:hypothetical protein F5Y14DRAFT_316544 [Nemania sp. NC0429]|nr:hypothetical protein F5Y14DRAFT_316544 [Nemania sp. NC0429]
MHSAALFVSAVALAASAFAQVLVPTPWFPHIRLPSDGETIFSGSRFTVEWNANGLVGPATLYLLGGGDPANLQILSTIASVDVNDAKYDWALDCSLGGQKTYLIKISSDSDAGTTFGVSAPFHIKSSNCRGTGSGGLNNYPSRPASYSSKPTSYSSYPNSYPAGAFSGYPTKPATVTVSSIYAGTPSSAAGTTTTGSSNTIVTPSSTPSGGNSGSTTSATPIFTAGATRAGAGLAVCLLAGALVL